MKIHNLKARFIIWASIFIAGMIAGYHFAWYLLKAGFYSVY